jgi:hypothetical protein
MIKHQTLKEDDIKRRKEEKETDYCISLDPKN